MFMDKSEYHQHVAAAATTSQYAAANGPHMMGSYTSSYNSSQYEMENGDNTRHICPVCNKTFRASSLLDIHMRVHVGAKPFVCPVCNHRATQKGNLKLHMKKHHGRDLPSHIDLVPDSGIWGNFTQNGSVEEMQLQLANKKKTALAHSSLLNDDVVELIKKCQNNIGQSTMGRITESLNDFLDMAQRKVLKNDSVENTFIRSPYKQVENSNSNNNGFKTPSKPAVEALKIPFHERKPSLSESGYRNEQPLNAERNPSKNYCYCKVCGWKTTSAGYLNVHMRKHKAESHVCTICGRGFKETWYLKNHMRSHIHNYTPEVENLQAESRRIDDALAATTRENTVPVDAEDRWHKLNDYNADCANCLECGLVFPKVALSEHSKVCGVSTGPSEDPCKVSITPKEVYMEALGLTNKPKSMRKSEHLKNFSSIIGSMVCTPSADHSQNTENTTVPLLFKKQIEGSIRLNGIAMAKNNLKDRIKNPCGKMLLSENLNNAVRMLDSKTDLASGSVSLLHSGNATEQTAYDRTQPYRNAAMRSLADIGKSLASMKAENDQSVSADASIDGEQQGFQCQFCFKWFKYKSVLGIHMRSHTGERPYKCGICGYAGTQHNCLKLHMQRHHPCEPIASVGDSNPHFAVSPETTSDIEQERMLLGQAAKFNPAKCPICSRVSPSPGYLKIHMRSHKQTLDHVCPICGRGFKEYWYLATHLRTHDQAVVASSQLQASSEKTLGPSHPLPVASSGFDATKRPIPSSTNPAESGRKTYNCTVSSSSWSPLNIHEHSKETSQPLSSRQPHVSKRKAFQPARYTAEPYPSDEPAASRSRKSKPRKLSQGGYLAPVFQKLQESGNAKMREECDRFEDEAKVDSEQPLDLSVSVATMTSSPWEDISSDEPLNLAIKN